MYLKIKLKKKMEDQNDDKFLLLDKTITDFMIAIESQEMYWWNGTWGPSLKGKYNIDSSLVSENFQMGELYFSAVNIPKGTIESEMIKAALQGTVIEQLQRITQMVLQKKLIRGNRMVAFLDKTKQKHPDGSMLGLCFDCYVDGRVSLDFYKSNKNAVWCHNGDGWLCGNSTQV